MMFPKTGDVAMLAGQLALIVAALFAGAAVYAAPRPDLAGHAGPQPLAAKSAAVCMAEHRDQGLRAATKMH
jgi:hypothetical protein